MKLSKESEYIIERLEENGFEAYAVGGYVRDMFLGKDAHDIDITTSAKPDEIKRIFPHTADTGIKYGTVSVILKRGTYEVTSFRAESAYSDGRHPGIIRFSKSITVDLSRRDFTMNAIAYSPKRGFFDPFGGINDIKAKVIRCVGNPETRFSEDALRALRALRFACQLGFLMDDETYRAAVSIKSPNISSERIRDEFGKMLLNTAHLKECFSRYGKISENVFPPLSVEEIDFEALENYHGNDAYIKWALLLKNQKDLGYILSELKFGKEAKRIINELINYRHFPCSDEKSIRRLLNFIGEDQVKRMLNMTGTSENILNKVISNNDCFQLSNLEVNGNDVINIIGHETPAVGNILRKILREVIDGNLQNDKNTLLRQIELLALNESSDKRE